MKPLPNQPITGIKLSKASMATATMMLVNIPLIMFPKCSEVFALLHRQEYMSHKIQQYMIQSIPNNGSAIISAPQNA